MQRTHRGRLAYTLIELMTVMAITAILLTIIVYPVFQVFGFTRQAQAFSDAQNKAKQIADRIGAEIADNAGVREGANHASFQISVKDSGGTAITPSTSAWLNSLVVPVPGQVDVMMTGWDSSWTTSKAAPAVLSNAMLDIFKAAQDGDLGVSGGYVNPLTGKVDPTLTEPKGQVQLPVTPGRTLIRYAITLRDPFHPYNNMYDGVLMKPLGGRDNLYVLRRFEVPTYILALDPADSKYYSVPNKMAFIDLERLTAAHRAGIKATAVNGPLYDDPFFMDPYHSLEGLVSTGTLDWQDASKPLVSYDSDISIGSGYHHHDQTPDPTKAEMITYWLKHSTIVTELSRYDMISAEYNLRTKAVVYDGNSPRVYPLIQFKPTRVTSEPAVGQTAVRPGQESDNAGLIGSDVFRTEKGMWSNPVVRLYPSGWTPSDPTTRYSIARQDSAAARGTQSIYLYNPAKDAGSEATAGIEVFDLGVYSQGGISAFSQGLAAANGRSAWVGSMSDADVRRDFEGFALFNSKGYVRSSFDISEVGTGVTANNYPTSAVNATSAVSPSSDTDPAGTYDPAGAYATAHPYSGAAYDANACFNRVWNDPATSFIKPDIHRFLDLRVTPQGDGALSPMDPTSGFGHVNIVPGTEEVWGPDQNPGPNYGNQVRYVRVTRNPGPNQYRINYTDQTEPTDYTVLGFAHNPPATYTPTDFVSAVIQPRYKRGYVQFDSDPNTPLPVGNITVRYRFQFTMPGDVVAVDYDTREVMNVLITVKNFPQSSLTQAQTVTVPATAKVRYVLK